VVAVELANPDDQDWLPYGLDSTTGKFGFEALGQDPNTVQDHDIIFVGDVNVASDATQAEVTVKSGSSTYSTKPIVGPVCSAGIQIKNADCSQWPAQAIPCTEVTPAPAGVFETVKAGRCPNEKQLHWLRNFTVSASPAVFEQCEQVITVQDKDGPTFSGIDEKDLYITLSCNEKAPDVPTTVEASDTCQGMHSTGSLVSLHKGISALGVCMQTPSRLWSFARSAPTVPARTTTSCCAPGPPRTSAATANA